MKMKMLRNTVTVLGCLALLTTKSFAADSTATMADYTLAPMSLTQENTPLVMLAMSNDQQLYNKAYPDFTDLDGDGVLDIRYKDSFSYSGYFDPNLCYEYDNVTDDRFKVSSAAGVEKDGNFGDVIHACDNAWSGNFLNWAAMTRMDVLRSVLYGGTRVVDDVTTTRTVDHDNDATTSDIKFGAAVLRRAYLPNDVHSFGKLKPDYDSSTNPNEVPLKYIVPTDFQKSEGISLCSTSNSIAEPELRVAKGLYPGWSMNSGTVCAFNDTSSPASSEQLGVNMTVEIEVCAAPLLEANNGRCRVYQDGDDYYFKPVGLLQKFGEDNRIQFGLTTGSFVNNTEGGIVRAEIHKLANNIASKADDDEIDLKNGAILRLTSDSKPRGGIINNLDRMRIYGWNKANGFYSGNCFKGDYNLKNDELKSNGSSWNWQCPDWGNPIGEIFYETLRYFSGKSSATDLFADDRTRDGTTKSDTDFLANLSVLKTWTNPLSDANKCTRCSTILISSGPTSFDNNLDDLIEASASGEDLLLLDTRSLLNARTNKVGDLEYGGLAGQDLIGKSEVGGIEVCVKKVMGSLSAEEGQCPDAPNLEGSYYVAGLAYHANITDLVSNATLTGDQNVSTYAIELADAVPALDFNVNGESVNLVPACHAGPSGDYHYCSLTDIQLQNLIVGENKDLKYARMHIAWEDSNWGMDYDLDLVQRLDICTNKYVDPTNLTDDTFDKTCSDLEDGQFYVKHQIVNWAGGHWHRVSYALSGTTADGLVDTWSLKKNQNNVDTGDYSWRNGPLSSDPAFITAVHTVSTDKNAVQPLKKPLYLAAKYGGFTDINKNGQPDDGEWDTLINETGAAGSDGIPDNYYQVRNPSTLERQLGRVFTSIISRVSAGSNAAVVANRASGNGAVYQAVYYPEVSDSTSTVKWVGRLHSLFVDEAGLLREDSDGDGRIGNYPVRIDRNSATAGDAIIQISFDQSTNDTLFQRYALWEAGTKVAVPVGGKLPLSDLDTVWDAAEQLTKLDSNNLQIQPTYGSTTGRYVLSTVEETCTDGNGNTYTCDTLIDFSVANVEKLKGYLGYSNDSLTAGKLISYIRGIDQTGFRSRTLGTKTLRLGDIVHSTPSILDGTRGRYDSSLGDSSYSKFAETYGNRRRMVFVGANDGLVHGFNGGFWNSVCNGFFVAPPKDNDDDKQLSEAECVAATNVTGKPELGAEMWAYAPKNLLPHLRWLADNDYGHVFYVDGEPETYDVRIWTDDMDKPLAEHPNGWGTILVVPMRTGGGEISVDHDNDTNTAAKAFRSAFVVLDVTNPEKPPKLIAEITDENLGFTVGKPTLVRNYQPNSLGDYQSPSKNQWYLVFGSGPTDKKSATKSTQDAFIFAYDLVNRKLYKNDTFATADQAEKSFFSSFATANWDRDGVDEAVYFGSVKQTTDDYEDQSGALYRWRITSLPEADDDAKDMKPTIMLATDQPIVSAPVLTRSPDANRWVHFGTGRFYVTDDRTTTKKQQVYGVLEPRGSDDSFTWGKVSKTGLKDVTDYHVIFDSGVIEDKNGAAVMNGANQLDYESLKPLIRAAGGWKKDLTYNGTDPAGRVLRDGLIYQDQYIFTEYVPSGDQCDVNGRSNLYSISWETGTALPYAPLDFVKDSSGQDTDEAATSTDLGVGEFSGVSVFETSDFVNLLEDGSDDLKRLENDTTGTVLDTLVVTEFDENCIFVQSSTGEMLCRRAGTNQFDRSGRQSWRELEILF